MKRIFQISFLILACSVFPASSTHAQFWKKIFKKEEKKPVKKTTATKKPVVKKEEPQLKKKAKPEYPETEKKESYRIDVLLPLNLNTLVQNGKPIYKRTPDNVMPSVNFYEGMTIAADALRERNVKLDIYIHDITDPADNIAQLAKNPGFAASDLIIGSLQSGDIPPVANFARQHKINFVSALSPADAGVKDNPYFILVQPTLKTHINQLIDFAGKKFGKNPKYIFHKSNTAGEKEAYSQLREALIDEKDLNIVDCSRFRMSTDSLSKLFDSTQTNVVFLSVLETSSAEQVLNALSALPRSYRFEIFGMPSWKSLRGLTQPSEYMGMSIYYTTPFFYDPTTGPGKYIGTQYKSIYGGNPSEMVYRGYETLYWMANLLLKHGTIFNEHISDVSAAQFTRYDIQPSWTKENDFLYLENTKLYILHYQNGGYIVEQQ
jgi:ABC-type branched-subunit amino acid transport system substrate-binding protein